MKVLVACEYSGTVRDAFIAKGHDAMSCDLLTTDVPGPHYQGDVRDVIGNGWDLMIAHHPCTYLSVSGIHWNNRGRGWEETEKALEFVRFLMDAPVARIAIENPISIISSKIRKPDQIIQPYQFGHDASKATCLWLKNLPKLKPTCQVEPRMVNGKPRWSNQTDSGQNRLPPSKDRWKIRSETFTGIASAMAEQWSESALSLHQNCQNANAVESLGALFAWSTTRIANASDPTTPKMKDGSCKIATGFFTESVHCPPGDPEILMRALSRR